jgi:mono/diheme cytochrome c family protein
MDFILLNLPAVIAGVVLIALLVAVLLYAARLSEPAAVATEPAGPATGSLSLERKVSAIVAMILGLVVLFFGYGLRESSRQDEARIQQRNQSIDRGINTYTTLCFSCHGEAGQGAVVPGSNPERVAPPLNRPDFQPTDPDEAAKTADMLFKTIQRGRPGTPMPAWGQTDGGALQDEQINELVLMIMNGATPIPYDNVTATPWTHTATVVKQEFAAGTIPALPQQPQVESEPWYQALDPQQQQGVKVILQFGCGGCHTIPNIPGAQGTIGPNEGANGDIPVIGQRRTIAGGAVPNNNQDDLTKWIENPSALKPGTAMPTLGLSPDQAAAAAAYLYSLQ